MKNLRLVAKNNNTVAAEFHDPERITNPRKPDTP